MHKLAKHNDDVAKQRMKREYDSRMRARECPIRVGDMVLHKWARPDKSKSIWDPNPYEVVTMKGSMVTAKRSEPEHKVTRNSSFFKILFDPSVSLSDRGEEKTDIGPEPINFEAGADVPTKVTEIGSKPINFEAEAEIPTNTVTTTSSPALSVQKPRLGRGRPTKVQRALRESWLREHGHVEERTGLRRSNRNK